MHKKFTAFLFEAISTCVSAVVVIAVVFSFGFRLTTVEGSSMEPTLSDKDKLIVSSVDGEYTYGPEPTGVTVTTWEIDSSEFYLSGNRWVIDFKGLNPAQMREAVQVTLYKDGVVVSDTAQYSVETYGTSVTEGTYLADLVEAMSKYGRSAWAYLYN